MGYRSLNGGGGAGTSKAGTDKVKVKRKIIPLNLYVILNFVSDLSTEAEVLNSRLHSFSCGERKGFLWSVMILYNGV
jgi:hypothetical protein